MADVIIDGQTMYEVTTQTGKFLLQASLPTIGAIFKLHQMAQERIMRADKEAVELHFGARSGKCDPIFGLHSITVRRI